MFEQLFFVTAFLKVWQIEKALFMLIQFPNHFTWISGGKNI